MLDSDSRLMNLMDYLQRRNLTKYLVLGFVVLFLILILQKLFLLVALVAMSLVISFFMGNYQMAKLIGIELVTFTTVLAGFAFGPTAGIFVGLFLIITHLTIGHFAAGTYIMWVVPAYLALGFLAGTLTGFDFATLGIYLAVGLNVFNLALTFLTFPQNLGNYLPYSITNVIFNLILFSQFGPIAASLVK